MKKNATRLLYVLSFSLLFASLYFNLAQHHKGEISLFKHNPAMEQSASSLEKKEAVAKPENPTALK